MLMDSQITSQELFRRQQWTLNQKIDHAVGSIESFINRTGKVPYVSFSGGKDSSVLLDIVRRFVRSDIKAVFDNTGNEFPEIVRFVRRFENVVEIKPHVNIRQLIQDNGFPLVSKEVAKLIREAKTTRSKKLLERILYGKDNGKGYTSGKLPDKWKYLIQAPFMVSEKCCTILKKRPFVRYNRQTGEVPIIGTLAQESGLRMMSYIRRGGCNSFKEGHLASYPLSIWTEENIWEYITRFDVPICELYYKFGCKRTGCMFCGFGAHMDSFSRFAIVYDLHPAYYKVFMRYSNNGVTYREALRRVGVVLPDEVRQLEIDFTY